MFTKTKSIVVIVVCLFTPTFTRADGLLYQLPMGNEWARFRLEGQGKDLSEAVTTLKGTFTISSVGTAQVEGKQCRWIEIAIQAKITGGEFSEVEKLLIPEEHLAKGKAPLNHVLRIWHKHSHVAGGEPRRIALDERGQRHLQKFEPFLHGPFKNAKKLKKTPIDSKLGKLECEGILAHEKTTTGPVTMDSTYTIRLHKKAPFGVVSWERKTNVKRSGNAVGTMITKMHLIDYGTNAKSALPGGE